MLSLRNIPNRGEVDKYYVENTHQAIIDKTVFQTVSKMFEKNMLRYGNRQKRASENFSGRIICGDCGWAYKKKSGNGDPKWVCTKDGIAGQRCNTHPVSEAVLKKAFVMMFNRLQQHKDSPRYCHDKRYRTAVVGFFRLSVAAQAAQKISVDYPSVS